MPDNKIDDIFKSQLVQMKDNMLPKNWDKHSSWERLQNKRKKRKLKLYAYAAAILLIGFLLGNLLQYENLNQNNSTFSENSFIEYQNRQKLKEIEERMSGNYYSVKICLACDNIYYQVIKQDRPVKFTYYETILN